MRPLISCLTVVAAMFSAALPLAAQEISVLVHPDDSVHVKQGYQYEQVIAATDSQYESQDIARVTVLFPDQSPSVYELDSEEDCQFIVDGWLPEGADILVQAVARATGQAVPAFEHVIRGGDWLIDAKYMNVLPLGESEIRLTLRTPGRPDAVISHPFYVLEPRDLQGDQDSPWFEWELNNDSDLGPYIPGEGFMSFNPPAGSAIYYVSATGSDSNAGVSKDSPLRTLRAAYEKVRDNSSDWILLKAGDTFDGGFGVWAKSGKSADMPLHVGVYGEGDRPIVHTNGEQFWRGYGEVSNIRIDGVHAYANRRLNADAGSLVWKETGFAHFGTGKNIVLHDTKIEGFKFGIVLMGYNEGAVSNVVLYRCIINNSFSHWDGAIGGHSSGIYADAIADMEIIECTFDHNGWNPDVSGASRTMFNHNLYIQSNCDNVNVRRSTITRGSSHGLQLRSGGEIVGNLFARNALAVQVAKDASVVTENVVFESDDISDKLIRGHGIQVNAVDRALVANNIIVRKVGRGGWLPGLALDAHNWSGAGHYSEAAFEVEMRDNILWDWTMDAPHKAIKVSSSANLRRSNNTVDGVVSENGSRVAYRNPHVDFDSYVEGGLSEFLKHNVLRRRGEWNEQFTASGFIHHIRDGFTPASGGGSI